MDLSVQRNYDLRPSASQLLGHIYLKKMKLTNVVSTLQMSVMAEGLVEVHKKIANETRQERHVEAQSVYDEVPNSISVTWNF